MVSCVVVNATVPSTLGFINDPPIAVKINIIERIKKRFVSEYHPANAVIPVEPIRKYPIARTKNANETILWWLQKT